MASCDQHLKISFNGAASSINARDEDALIASLAESGTSKSGVSAPAPAPAPGGVPLSHRMTQKLQSWVVGCCLTCALLAKAIWLDSLTVAVDVSFVVGPTKNIFQQTHLEGSATIPKEASTGVMCLFVYHDR